MSLNIDSLLKHIDEFRVFIDQEKPHIVSLNETKLDQSICDSSLEVANYDIIRNDRNRFGGGVALYVNKNLSYKVRTDLMVDKLESVSVQIKNGSFKPFIVTSIYRPPEKPVSYFSHIECLIASLESEIKESIIMGDTNCDFLNPSNNNTKNLKRILNSFELTQLIKEPTWTTATTKTIIDHIITNKPTMVSNSGVISCGISDHDAVFIERNVRAPKLKVPPKILNVHNFKRFDSVSFQADIKGIPTERIRSVSGGVNEMWHWWKTFFLDILNKHAPVAKIKVKGNHLPYVTSELKSMIRQRDYLRAKANKTGSNLLRQAYNHIKNRVNYKLFTLRKNYYSDKIEENKGNLKGTWKILRQAIGLGNKSVGIDKIVSNGSDTSDSGDIARVCNQHFVTVGRRLAEKIPFTDESPTAHIKVANVKFQFSTIAASQIVKVIKKLINNKATGIHDIPNKILKDNVSILSPYLEEIFNFSIKTGVFPNEFKIGKVTPIFKSGEKEDLNNYRPISVLPTIARVFEKLLYNQLYKFFTENQLLGDQQYGFRSLHSTALALGKCSNQWLMNIDNGKINSVIFLDIRKAFDTVNHEILLQKLSSYGIKGDTHKFFESYLKDI